MSNHESEDPHQGHHLEFYRWRLQLFAENRMTHDKTLLQLSSAGIGLVITIFAAFKKFDSLSGALFLSSAGLLAMVIVLVLKTFKLNALAVKMPEGEELTKLNTKMGRFDLASETLFIIAGLMLFSSSVSLYFHQSAIEEDTVNTKDKSSNQNRQVDGTDLNKNSLEGFGGMKPPAEKPKTTGATENPKPPPSKSNGKK